MTALLRAGGHVVELASPLIRAADADPIQTAAGMLQEAAADRTRAQDEAEAQRQAAEAEGRAAAFAEARAEVAETVAEWTRQVDTALDARRADIAAAALAATRAIIGTFDEEAVVARLADGVLGRAGADEHVVLTVASGQADPLRERLGDRAHLEVREDPAVGRYHCTLATADGVVVAGLPTQLAALADRWGLA